MARAVLFVEKIGILDRILRKKQKVKLSTLNQTHPIKHSLQFLQGINHFFARIHEAREHGGGVDLVMKPIEVHLVVEGLH